MDGMTEKEMSRVKMEIKQRQKERKMRNRQREGNKISAREK